MWERTVALLLLLLFGNSSRYYDAVYGRRRMYYVEVFYLLFVSGNVRLFNFRALSVPKMYLRSPFGVFSLLVSLTIGDVRTNVLASTASGTAVVRVSIRRGLIHAALQPTCNLG